MYHKVTKAPACMRKDVTTLTVAVKSFGGLIFTWSLGFCARRRSDSPVECLHLARQTTLKKPPPNRSADVMSKCPASVPLAYCAYLPFGPPALPVGSATISYGFGNSQGGTSLGICRSRRRNLSLHFRRYVWRQGYQ
ncbi:hypothetical protein MGG_15910 [Pyricularia oryzae 70-15]|uniref:Uncharacterized protein n=3 Tax=Pyricularia oryzae TaxID=318829 RepID=G4MVG7_PYRO7|nr:uncharacterized protein MGG_15910 [Pyricularia oryzae 70-15]EHA55793.1 hypothetical protein MGG_15910 [Pyricularia oryzae 70-15]